jgi:sporulation protein YlmC with PRC-barrel domain
MTETEEMTDTGAAEATPTTEVGGTGVITGTEEMTGTSDLTDTEGMTGTSDLTGAEEVTGTEGTTAGADAGTDETTGVRGVVRTSELLGYNVQNFAGEELGSINDAMVSLPDGCIDYMILSFGGILGLGDSLFLIPWRIVTVDPVNDRLVLNVDPEALNEAPLFDVDNLPDFASPDWDAEARAFWENMELLTPDASLTETMTGTTGLMDRMGSPCAGALPGFAAEATETTASEAMTDTTGIEIEMPRVIRLSELMSFDVTNSEGEDLGAIEDLMLDWRQDRIVYMILSFGGFLGLGEKWFPIPLDRVRLDPIEQRIIFDVEPETLESAPGFDEAELPDTGDANWDEDIYNFWEQIQ